jgi:hypothetical protein
MVRLHYDENCIKLVGFREQNFFSQKTRLTYREFCHGVNEPIITKYKPKISLTILQWSKKIQRV